MIDTDARRAALEAEVARLAAEPIDAAARAWVLARIEALASDPEG